MGPEAEVGAPQARAAPGSVGRGAASPHAVTPVHSISLPLQPVPSQLAQPTRQAPETQGFRHPRINTPPGEYIKTTQK